VLYHRGFRRVGGLGLYYVGGGRLGGIEGIFLQAGNGFLLLSHQRLQLGYPRFKFFVRISLPLN
jgi:hypothetical protein